MDHKMKSLSTLKTLDNTQIEQLKKIDINNLGDLLAFNPFRIARLIQAASENVISHEEVVGHIDDKARDKTYMKY